MGFDVSLWDITRNAAPHDRSSNRFRVGAARSQGGKDDEVKLIIGNGVKWYVV